MNSLATTGKYTPDARAVSSQVLGSTASTVTAVASTAASAAIAPTLFMATANPATLMQLGSGVGSAVMGASGIAAQAPFIPVAASLPVVAPLALMGIVNTAVTMRQFQAVNAKLDTLVNTLTDLLVRTDITQIAGLIAASKTLGDITEEYDELGHFTPTMIARFAVAEQALVAVARRQELLLLSQKAARWIPARPSTMSSATLTPLGWRTSPRSRCTPYTWHSPFRRARHWPLNVHNS